MQLTIVMLSAVFRNLFKILELKSETLVGYLYPKIQPDESSSLAKHDNHKYPRIILTQVH